MRNPASNQILPATGTAPKVLSSSKESLKSSKESLKSQKKGPNFLSCHICSRPFASASLPIHIPQCLQKWKMEQAKLPKSKRATVEPVRDARMDTMAPEEWNKVAEQNSRDAMPACSHCNRKFNIDRLAKHESACTMNKSKGTGSVTVGLDGGTSAKKQAHQTSQRAQAHEAVMSSTGPSINRYDMKIVDPMKNPMRVCAICTREFGSKSIGLHIPQCAKKFVLEQERLHMPRSQRRTMEELIAAANNSLAARPATAVMAVNPHDEVLLKGAQDGIVVPMEVAPTIDFRTPCPNCSRKFNPDRLPVHLRSCKAK